MIHWNNLKSSEKISLWRNFRLELQKKESLTDLETLKEVTTFFATIPRDSRSIDYYTPESWPTAWEILHYNFSCDSSISLMNYYTMLLVKPDSVNDCELYLIDNSVNEFLIPIFYKKYLMNYDYSQVVELDDVKNEIKIMKKFKKEELPSIQ